MSIRIIKRKAYLGEKRIDALQPPNDPIAPVARASVLGEVLDKLVISLALKAASEDHDKELKLREE